PTCAGAFANCDSVFSQQATSNPSCFQPEKDSASVAAKIADMSVPTPPPAQPRNPLHGLTLEAILTALVAHYGWPGLGERIPVRCFLSDPSIKSSLAFLRRTPWAREQGEGLYLFMLRDQRHNSNDHKA